MTEDVTGYALLAQVAMLESLQDDLTRCATLDDVDRILQQRLDEVEKSVKRHAMAKSLRLVPRKGKR